MCTAAVDQEWSFFSASYRLWTHAPDGYRCKWFSCLTLSGLDFGQRRHITSMYYQSDKSHLWPAERRKLQHMAAIPQGYFVFAPPLRQKLLKLEEFQPLPVILDRTQPQLDAFHPICRFSCSWLSSSQWWNWSRDFKVSRLGSAADLTVWVLISLPCAAVWATSGAVS